MGNRQTLELETLSGGKPYCGTVVPPPEPRLVTNDRISHANTQSLN